jgi:hypothetical protein
MLLTYFRQGRRISATVRSHYSVASPEDRRSQGSSEMQQLGGTRLLLE